MGGLKSIADGRRAIEAFGQVDGIADGDLGGIDLVGPDLEPLELRLAVDGGEGAVHRVEAVRDLDAADARHVEARVEGAPVVAEIDLEIGVEIHRRAGIDVADVGQMAGDVARGNIERAAERDGHVREIAADAVALQR